MILRSLHGSNFVDYNKLPAPEVVHAALDRLDLPALFSWLETIRRLGPSTMTTKAILGFILGLLHILMLAQIELLDLSLGRARVFLLGVNVC